MVIPVFLYIFWQTDRNPDLDIYGSYIVIYGGIQESIADLQNNVLLCIPNPASDLCDISYYLNESGIVNLALYDTKGGLVKKIYTGFRNPGVYRAKINVNHLRNGVYFIKLNTETKCDLEKIVVVK